MSVIPSSFLILKYLNSYNMRISLLLLMWPKKGKSKYNTRRIMLIIIIINSYHGSDDEANFFSSAQRSYIVIKCN